MVSPVARTAPDLIGLSSIPSYSHLLNFFVIYRMSFGESFPITANSSENVICCCSFPDKNSLEVSLVNGDWRKTPLRHFCFRHIQRSRGISSLVGSDVSPYCRKNFTFICYLLDILTCGAVIFNFNHF